MLQEETKVTRMELVRQRACLNQNLCRNCSATTIYVYRWCAVVYFDGFVEIICDEDLSVIGERNVRDSARLAVLLTLARDAVNQPRLQQEPYRCKSLSTRNPTGENHSLAGVN